MAVLDTGCCHIPIARLLEAILTLLKVVKIPKLMFISCWSRVI